MEFQNLNFCCESFKSYYLNGEIIENGRIVSEHYPSIRVIQIKRTIHDDESDHLFRVIIVSGFLNDKDRPPFIIIRYCPFCGVDLYKIYSKPQYINLNPALLGL